MKATVDLDIKCCLDCPFKGIDGGPGPVMVCNHPTANTMEKSYIISHPECDTGFPKECPLLKKTK